jgi:D-alanyl-D-alanine dipeptidase
MTNHDYLRLLLQEVGQRSIVPHQKGLTRDQMNQVPIIDCSEKLVHVSRHPKIFYISGELAEKYPLCRGRFNLKLSDVADILPERLGLGLRELYRPVEIQIFYRQTKFNSLKNLYQEKTDDEIWKIVDQYVSRPGGPHQTGGATDVTLVWMDTGLPLDMGTEFGLPDTKSHTNSNLVSWEAQVHRYLLWAYMTSVGFRNYPNEWWHYEYGTRRWAKYLNLETAFYGVVENTAA